MIRNLASLFVLCLAGAASAATLSVDLNGIKVGLDKRTGSIVSLSRPGPGVVLAASPESAGLVDVAYPVKPFMALRLAARFSKARIVHGPNEVTIIWDKLGPSRGHTPLPGGKVRAEVRLKASPDGRSVIMSCRIANNSKAPIPQVIFPDLWGIRAFGGANPTSIDLAGFVGGAFGQVKDPLQTPFFPSLGPSAWSAPKNERDALRKVEIAAAGGGMTVLCSKDAPLPDRLFVHRKEASPEQMRLLWEHKNTIAPGQAWESGEYWLTLYAGERVNGLPHLRKFSMNGLEIGLDEETGNIVQMKHPATGTLLEYPQGIGIGSLLEVSTAAKAEDDKMLSSRYSKARLEQSGKTVKVIWDGLESSDGKVPGAEINLAPVQLSGAGQPAGKDLATSGSKTAVPAKAMGKVSAEVTIGPAPDGRSMVMSCAIRNGLDTPLRTVRFPDLRGFKAIDGSENTRLMLPRMTLYPFTPGGYEMAPRNAFVTQNGKWKVMSSIGYYGPLALRWLDYGGFKGGISMFQRKWRTWETKPADVPSVMTQRAGAGEDSLSILWAHDAEIKPGETWTSGEFWLTPHEGGWAKGIEVFREYARQARPARALPSHVRDGLGFQSVWMMLHPMDMDPQYAAFKYKDIVAAARDARDHGIDELAPWFWTRNFELPLPTVDALGTRKDFLAGIRKAKRLGVNVAPFISVTLVRNRLAPRYGAPQAAESWAYHPELIPAFRAEYVDHLNLMEGIQVAGNNKVWLQDVQDALAEWIGRGLYSFGWDLWGPSPELVERISKMRELARSKDPESTYYGESLAGLECENLLDYTWNWVDEVNADPFLSVLKSPRLNCNVEGPMAAKMAFMGGYYLNVMPRKPDQANATSLISEIPELSKAVKECAALRKQFLAYFVEGDPIGDSMLREPSSAFVRGHLLGGKMLVFVLNDHDKPQTVSIKSSLGLWLPKAENYQVKTYDSTGKELQTNLAHGSEWSGITRTLAPCELAIFEIETR